ncbi:MAG: tetratricopeptide repeat protein, partial [Deltaproteobacteria bacterium]
PDDKRDEESGDAPASTGSATTDRRDDEADDSSASNSRDSASSDDESDEDDDASDRDDDEEDDSGDGEQRILVGSPDDQVQEELPRNRAERRQLARQKRRGQIKEVEDDSDAAAVASGRPRVPPKTVTGKTNADEIPVWAKSSVNWLTSNGKSLALGAALVLAVAGGAVFWSWRRDDQLAKGASAYRDAIEISTATIRAADAPPEPAGAPTRRTPTFVDRNARAQAALRAFREVESRYGNSPVASLARLSAASTLYDLGRYAEARPIFERLLGADSAGQDARVLEGLGFTLEALNDNAAALTKFQELGRIQDGAYRDLAGFHQARVEQRMGHNDRARDLLHGVIERLRRTSTDEALGTSGTVLEGARALLRDIAPEDPMAAAERPANDQEAMMRQLQQRFGNQIRIQRPGEAPAGGGGSAPAPPPGAPPASP